jgi:hypothetical protein
MTVSFCLNGMTILEEIEHAFLSAMPEILTENSV